MRRASLRAALNRSDCELSGDVAWVRGVLVEGAPPGFGVRLVELCDEARQLRQTYAAALDPSWATIDAAAPGAGQGGRCGSDLGTSRIW